MSEESGAVQLADLPVEWRTKSSWRGLLHVGLVWLGILAAVALVGLTRSWLVGAGAFLFIGVLQNNISSLLHHALHGDLHPSKRLNDLVCRLFLTGPQGQLLGVVRWEHLHHHARFGMEDDPERVYYDLEATGVDTPQRLRRHVVRLFLGWVVAPNLRRALTGDRGGLGASNPTWEARRRTAGGNLADLTGFLVAQTGIAAAMWSLTGWWWAWAVWWALPLATVGAGLTVLRATLEHASPEDPDRRLFSFTSNPLERFVFGPFQFNYHYEHHRFMSVPYYWTPAVHRLLAEQGDQEEARIEPSYLGRLRSLIRELESNRAGSPAT